MNVKHIAKMAVATLCLVAGALSARADNILTAQTFLPQFWAGNLARPLLINQGPGGTLTIIPIPVPVTGKVSVTYTAECYLNAGTGSYIFITILIDNQPMTPTGPGDAFCSGRSGAVGGGAARRSITVSRTLLGGFIHQMRIFAQVSGTHTGARIGASTLVVAQ